MYSLKRNIFLLTGWALFSLATSACTSKQELEKKAFFNFDSLVNAQVRYLVEKKPSLYKNASMGNEEENAHLKPEDSITWANELAIFRQLDVINKPIHKSNYLVTEGQPDTNSNLLINEYRAKEELKDKMALAYLKIYYQGTPQHVRKIEGLYQEKNTLYEASRYLTLELSNIYNHTALTAYTIQGGQKMILGDSVAFHITGNLTYPL